MTADAEHDAVVIPGLGGPREVGAEPMGPEALVTPTRDLRDDGRVPGAAGRRGCTGHVEGEDSRERDPPLALVAAELGGQICLRARQGHSGL